MKKFLIAVISLLALFSSFSSTILAKDNSDKIPEIAGIYNDPDHPGIKVRVFVHKSKPNPKPEPTLQCGLLDNDSGAVVADTGWKLPRIWSYNLNTSSIPKSIGSSNLAAIAEDGFSVWQSAVDNKVIFSPGPETTTNRQAYDAKNIVAWGRTNGSALAVTYIRYTSDGTVVDVDTIMNLKFTWSWTDQGNPATYQCALSDTYDAQDILTHELGHWIGLEDHYTSDYANNTMYGYGAMTEIKKDTLTSGDIEGAQHIYNP